jgi:hypothetical protein
MRFAGTPTTVRHEGAERSEMSYSLTAAMLHKR